MGRPSGDLLDGHPIQADGLLGLGDGPGGVPLAALAHGVVAPGVDLIICSQTTKAPPFTQGTGLTRITRNELARPRLPVHFCIKLQVLPVLMVHRLINKSCGIGLLCNDLFANELPHVTTDCKH